MTNTKNKLKFLLGLCLLSFLAFGSATAIAQTVITSIPAPTVLFSTGTPGSMNTNVLAASTTANAFPYTNVYVSLTNSSVTNTVTNTWNGVADVHNQITFAVQMIWTYLGGTTNGGSSVFQFAPSLDGVNFDTNNSTFYVTNLIGTNAVQASFTTNFSPLICNGITSFKLLNIVINGTNGMTNVTVQYSPKREFAHY